MIVMMQSMQSNFMRMYQVTLQQNREEAALRFGD
jgi:hypothetical protein